MAIHTSHETCQPTPGNGGTSLKSESQASHDAAAGGVDEESLARWYIYEAEYAHLKEKKLVLSQPTKGLQYPRPKHLAADVVTTVHMFLSLGG